MDRIKGNPTLWRHHPFPVRTGRIRCHGISIKAMVKTFSMHANVYKEGLCGDFMDWQKLKENPFFNPESKLFFASGAISLGLIWWGMNILLGVIGNPPKRFKRGRIFSPPEFYQPPHYLLARLSCVYDDLHRRHRPKVQSDHGQSCL